MTTSENTRGTAARHGRIVAGLMLLALAACAPSLGHADTATVPVSQCSDFACER